MSSASLRGRRLAEEATQDLVRRLRRRPAPGADRVTLTVPSPREAALEYATRGWLVFPCQGKKPDGKLAPQGFQNATTSAVTLRAWWAERPDANVAVATGERSGLFVLDVDPAGLEALADLELQHGQLPATVRARTGRNGLHVFFRYPKVGRLGNSAGKLGPGLDTRGQGGYVVLAPSVHPETRARYVWLEDAGPDEVELADVPAWLVELLAEKPRPDVRAAVATPRNATTDAYAAAALRDELDVLARAPEGSRNDQLNEAAFSLGQLVGAGALDQGEVETALEQTALAIGLEERETAATIASGITAGKREPRSLPAPAVVVDGIRHPLPATATQGADDGDASAPTAIAAAAPTPRPLTDLGNAERLVDQHGADLRYCHAWKTHLTWDGRRWDENRPGEVYRRAKLTVRTIYAEAGMAAHEIERRNISKWAVASESHARIAAMVALAQSDRALEALPQDFDTDPWLFNCANGTIDLRTGRLRPPRREDLITKLAPVAFDPGATCPRWLAFLERVMGGDHDLVDFLRRAVGYALTGRVSEQCLFFLFGQGQNGKSTFVTTIQALMGGYAQQAAPDLLLSKKGDGNHPTELMDLAGARFVATIEVEDGRRLAEALLKQLTGGDRIKGRRIRENFWEFDPTHKFFLVANHKPVIRGTDKGIWRRIHLVPFEVIIPDAEKDEELPDKLRAELPGILAWAVQGCLDWQRGGLRIPEKVREATAEYRSDMDTLAGFLDDRCVVDELAAVTSSRLFTAYKAWCEETGERPDSQKVLGGRLSERGFVRTRIGKKREKGWAGVGLRDAGDPAGGPMADPSTLPKGPPATQAASSAEEFGGPFDGPDGDDSNSDADRRTHADPNSGLNGQWISHGGVTPKKGSAWVRQHEKGPPQSRTPAGPSLSERADGSAGVPDAGVLTVGQLVYPLDEAGRWLTERPVPLAEVTVVDGETHYVVDDVDGVGPCRFTANQLEPVNLLDERETGEV
jgi:putative DNA primase/helicase